MIKEIQAYNESQTPACKAICDCLFNIIQSELAEAAAKIWHAHPVWFLQENPVVGYSKQKAGIGLLFWSGADFEEDRLKPGSGKFKDASIRYTSLEQVDLIDLKHG